MRLNGTVARKSTILESMHPATQRWFTEVFGKPTRAQSGAWSAIARGDNTLVVAPTGSGKTLAAFLWAIDSLYRERLVPVGDRPSDPTDARPGVRVLYVSPLKALAVDVERNLSAPLVGIANAAANLGLDAPTIRVGVRSGDTPAADRRRLQTHPPDILITTPESLYLMLTSSVRETLATVTTVIVDEVHAVAATKRGTHLALSLERLDARLDAPAQRIGLSATVRPESLVAEFLSGDRPSTVVKPPATKTFDLTVEVPVEDMANIPPAATGADGLDDAFSPTAGSLWPHVEAAIVDRIEANRSTIVFANSRRLAERLTARLNEIAAQRAGLDIDANRANPEVPGGMPSYVSGSGTTAGAAAVLARAHHGSVSKEQRAEIEDDLKSGRLRCVVATSSLELGIDMGAVDLVIQVEAPPSVASALQRIGRAGHQVGEVSRGVLFPKHRTDLIHCTVVTQLMLAGRIEALSVPANPLDILAQQTIAATAVDDLDVNEWYATVRRAMPYRTLTRDVYDAVLDLISGRYPSDEFAELRPRVDYDRTSGILSARRGTLRLAVTSGGTIPDRGLFGVFLIGSEDSTRSGQPRRVGELDEEMVYESRIGDVFALGASSWRIEEITHDRVLVSPAFGLPGRLPFWIGDAVGRPAELGAAIGKFVGVAGDDEKLAAVSTDLGLSSNAHRNLAALITEQREATGVLPTDRTLVLERFRDELGDWRLVLHSPYGLRVHAPWASAIAAQLSARLGLDGATTATDDGIIVRLPDTDDAPPGAEVFVLDPAHIEDDVTRALADSSLFASRFRECAGRALLLPRRDPGKRAPLWQQRQRSAQLLAVAARFPDFPIILETVRECLADVYDLPALIDVLTRIAQRKIRVTEVETSAPSPFAASMLLGYVGSFIYDDDAPLAERRATALSLDTALLAQLLGRVDLRELLDPAVIEEVVARLQRTAPERRARDREDLVDLLRWLGPCTREEIADRYRGDDALPPLLVQLLGDGLLIEVSMRGVPKLAAVDDAARLRDGLGIPMPLGVPVAHLQAVADPITDLVHRYARTHGPFTVADIVADLGMAPAVVARALDDLAGRRAVIEGEFTALTPDQQASQWCHSDVLTQLRRGSLAAGRAEVEPVSADAYTRFLLGWQRITDTTRPRGVAGVAAAVEQLAGQPIPASAWETLVLPSRVDDYQPAMLDELTASGEVVWSGHGGIGGADGWVALHLADSAPLTLRPASDFEPEAPHTALLEALDRMGAVRFRELSTALADAGTPIGDQELPEILWDLVWAGLVTNDSFSVVRAALDPPRTAASTATSAHRTRGRAPRLRAARLSSHYLAGATTVATPAHVGGRWSVIRRVDVDPTAAAAATCEVLLDRYGVVTKGSVAAESTEGGFARIYKALAVFEDNGQVRRGYYIDGLGGAQFAAGHTVDLLRESVVPSRDQRTEAVVLAATDPANPYGAALDWPDRPVESGHRPGRKPGAVVVVVGGRAVVFVERGGKTVLTFETDEQALATAAGALVRAVTAGHIPRIHIDQVDGEPVRRTALGEQLVAAGFATTPRGLRMNYDPRRR
ncbi:ATP-dependent helicase [Gordonia sp. (in: high G+C Gram-positive bacteria)]|uniref:ATP-dependent helicase n=1 Tax=Gordonia sp. (in: high G+C Gram-positive bacteria) TaxID=84139 RepID=UPI001690E96D|nr:ATP-dependent helicase [Gordonia sp. (in: high G+C Gram-positive bacteria)]NLG47814.1 ATP-dependent helicase [Gordonia sp. (in: high G+C Gram-positive bacteria)]